MGSRGDDGGRERGESGDSGDDGKGKGEIWGRGMGQRLGEQRGRVVVVVRSG